MNEIESDLNYGYIKIWRKIFQWGWYKDVNTLNLFIHCILKANHKTNYWRNEIVERGSFISSYQHLSNETGLSIQQVRTGIKHLISTNNLTCKPSSKYTLFTVCNYDLYQSINTQNNMQVTKHQQTNNKQLTTNNNDKNDNKLNNMDGCKPLPYKEIIDYLNMSTNKNFKYSTKKTKDLIHARFNEGFTLQDFKKVIDIKTVEWINNPNMSKYLRPETLFSNKFESYLQQESNNTSNGSEFSFDY